MKQISKPAAVNPEVKKSPQSVTPQIELPKPVKVNRVGQKVT